MYIFIVTDKKLLLMLTKFSPSELITHRSLHTSIGCGQVSKMAPVSGSPMEVVEQRIKDNKVMVFSKTTCPFCTKIKNLFDSLGFKYEVLELDQLGKFFKLDNSFFLYLI